MRHPVPYTSTALDYSKCKSTIFYLKYARCRIFFKYGIQEENKGMELREHGASCHCPTGTAALQSRCSVTAKPLQSHCKAVAAALQAGCSITAKWMQHLCSVTSLAHKRLQKETGRRAICHAKLVEASLPLSIHQRRRDPSTSSG